MAQQALAARAPASLGQSPSCSHQMEALVDIVLEPKLPSHTLQSHTPCRASEMSMQSAKMQLSTAADTAPRHVQTALRRAQLRSFIAGPSARQPAFACRSACNSVRACVRGCMGAWVRWCMGGCVDCLQEIRGYKVLSCELPLPPASEHVQNPLAPRQAQAEIAAPLVPLNLAPLYRGAL